MVAKIHPDSGSSRQRGNRLALRAFGAAFIALLCAIGGGERALAQSCSITPANGAYGAVDILSGAVDDTTTTYTVSCSGTANQTVRLCIEIGGGSQTNGAGQRVLRTGANDLLHELYSDAARTTILGSWGSVITAYTPSPVGLTHNLALGAGGSANNVFTLYGRVQANQQTKPPGSYTWSSSASPGIRYGYAGASSCPTGGGTATSGGSTWTATISANCLVSATNISFGSVAALTSIIDATGTVTVQCTNTTPYNVGLNAGTGSGATVTTRKMTSGASTINYSLYRNSCCSQVWGVTIGTNTVSGTGAGNNQNLTVYGRIPVQTTPNPGLYTDTITVTVTY
jgi:spore coat protein U-like protein